MHDVGRHLAGDNLELVLTAVSPIHDQLDGFRQNTMLGTAHPTQHLLISTDAEKADVQIPGFYRQIKGRLAWFGRVYVVAVTGDAAQLDALERFVQVIQREQDKVLAQGPSVREGGHDGAINDVPGQ